MSRHCKKSDLIISDMTGKLKGIRALNCDTTRNKFCQAMQRTNGVCKECYSQRLLTSYRVNCLVAYSHNSKILAEGVLGEEQIPEISRPIFRFNAHGELENETHAKNYHNIAKKNSNTIFGWWTKRPELLRGLEKLNNVNYIYSTREINSENPRVPEGFDKVFSVYTKEYAKENNINVNCKGSVAGGCKACMLCYTKNDVKYINEIIK